MFRTGLRGRGRGGDRCALDQLGVAGLERLKRRQSADLPLERLSFAALLVGRGEPVEVGGDQRARLLDLPAVGIPPEDDVVLGEGVGQGGGELRIGIGRLDRGDIRLALALDVHLVRDLVSGEAASQGSRRAVRHRLEGNERDVRGRLAGGVGSIEVRRPEDLLVEAWVAKEQRGVRRVLLRLHEGEDERRRRGQQRAGDDEGCSAEEPGEDPAGIGLAPTRGGRCAPSLLLDCPARTINLVPRLDPSTSDACPRPKRRLRVVNIDRRGVDENQGGERRERLAVALGRGERAGAEELGRTAAAAANAPGHAREIAELYEEHVWSVYGFFGYRVGSRADAEDLTQLTFERACAPGAASTLSVRVPAPGSCRSPAIY